MATEPVECICGHALAAPEAVPSLDALRGLATKWRENSGASHDRGGYGGEALRMAASDLEALLDAGGG
jgi:hypothetical protein